MAKSKDRQEINRRKKERKGNGGFTDAELYALGAIAAQIAGLEGGTKKTRKINPKTGKKKNYNQIWITDPGVESLANSLKKLTATEIDLIKDILLAEVAATADNIGTKEATTMQLKLNIRLKSLKVSEM